MSHSSSSSNNANYAYLIVSATLWLSLIVHSALETHYKDDVTLTSDDSNNNAMDWMCMFIVFQSWLWIRFGFLDNVSTSI